MKIHTFFSVIFITLSQLAVAKQNPHVGISQKVDSLEQHLGEITTDTALGKPSITTTTSWPDIEGNQWNIFIDVLLWKAKIAGTSFATTNNQFSVTEPIHGYCKDNHMHWDFGLKLGLSKKLNYDTWGLSGEFTYFTTTGGASAKGGVENAIIPLKGPFAHPVQLASSQVKLKFYNIDLHLSRNYFISRTLALQPFLGVKNTWNTFTQKVFYSKGPSLLNNTAATKDKNGMWGIGPEVGLDTTWYVGKGCHVNGLCTASILYSYFNVKQHSYTTPSEAFNVFLSDKHHQFVPNMQCALGLGWSRFLNDKKNYLSFDINYETQYYWQMNQTLFLYEFKDTFRVQNMSADIAFYGVSAQIKLFF